MVKSKVNKSLETLKQSIINDIVDKIKTLDLKDEELIIEEITKTKAKRKAPTIPLEKQCIKKCKDGSKCTVPKCYKKTCWAHLTKDQRKEYQSLKAEKI
uniref:Putative terminal recognition factor n=1 Tax=Millerozyma acaciae TaxID=28986 RepID=Q2P9S6_9ASCO|nr:putative terminal recognition factor [Millerozyma acaciae]